MISFVAPGHFDCVAEFNILPGIDLCPVELDLIHEDPRRVEMVGGCPLATTFTVESTIGSR